MKTKFQVGDKIRCINGYTPQNLIEGNIYTVASYNSKMIRHRKDRGRL